MTTRTKRVTKRDAQKVLTAVKRRFKPWIDAGYNPPTLNMDFDWLGHGGSPHIVWEEGPYDWAVLDPGGDIEEEFGFTVPALVLPDGVYTEPMTGWALGIYLIDP